MAGKVIEEKKTEQPTARQTDCLAGGRARADGRTNGRKSRKTTLTAMEGRRAGLLNYYNTYEFFTMLKEQFFRGAFYTPS